MKSLLGICQGVVPLDHMVNFIFSLLRNFYLDFQSGSASLQTYQQHEGSLYPPAPQHFFNGFLALCHSTWGKMYPQSCFCIHSLIDDEHFGEYFLSILFLLLRTLFRSLVIFFNCVICFLDYLVFEFLILMSGQL